MDAEVARRPVWEAAAAGARSGLAPDSGRPDRGRTHRAGGGGCCRRAAGAAQTSSSRGRGPGRLGWKEEGPGGGGGIGRSRGGAPCLEKGGRVRSEDRRRAPTGEVTDSGGPCRPERTREGRRAGTRRRPGASGRPEEFVSERDVPRALPQAPVLADWPSYSVTQPPLSQIRTRVPHFRLSSLQLAEQSCTSSRQTDRALGPRPDNGRAGKPLLYSGSQLLHCTPGS